MSRLDAVLDAVDELILYAWPNDEAFNPTEYTVSGDDLMKLSTAYQMYCIEEAKEQESTTYGYA